MTWEIGVKAVSLISDGESTLSLHMFHLLSMQAILALILVMQPMPGIGVLKK